VCVVSWCDCVRELWEGEICGMKWKFGGGSSHKIVFVIKAHILQHMPKYPKCSVMLIKYVQDDGQPSASSRPSSARISAVAGILAC
jgi:hypothetical protein